MIPALLPTGLDGYPFLCSLTVETLFLPKSKLDITYRCFIRYFKLMVGQLFCCDVPNRGALSGCPAQLAGPGARHSNTERFYQIKVQKCVQEIKQV